MAAAVLSLTAAQAAPSESLLRIEVARQWADKGEYDKAVEELRLYLSEHPDSPEIYARIGSLRMKQGNFRLAGENYKIALAKDPHLREAREGLAMAYEKAGDKVKADEERRKLGQSSRLAAGTAGKGKDGGKTGFCLAAPFGPRFRFGRGQPCLPTRFPCPEGGHGRDDGRSRLFPRSRLGRVPWP